MKQIKEIIFWLNVLYWGYFILLSPYGISYDNFHYENIENIVTNIKNLLFGGLGL